jgi:hypothetical protein
MTMDAVIIAKVDQWTALCEAAGLCRVMGDAAQQVSGSKAIKSYTREAKEKTGKENWFSVGNEKEGEEIKNLWSSTMV